MKIKVINKSGASLPEYSKKGDAGVDLKASFCEGINEDFLDFAEWDEEGKYLIVFSGGRCLIPTNLYTAIPEGYELQIRPRSGLALKHGVTVLNTPGTIDSNYRGNIGIILINFSDEPFIIKEGDRIAQAVLNKFETIEWELVFNLDKTDRNEGGFGHTGK